ncbi:MULTISPECIES: hypothetical protein [unclassified Pseudodesulfovibrio]|uniref:hypothetical protein n=1 Tax=unclassified Pseudodesulfovibrio TaxID=2661612 RepID=UPI000FEC08C9|nr:MULTISPECIES: hypothetical protein [unclassified Pseudodesulfovibrio]MCJ2165906.1 hypothetical protein [Pseudodesulfovibrio sp. S3-i]RWU02661.1 hypothetical protein DWB63_15070 [Pseudodesulfovibrio sp. S3]
MSESYMEKALLKLARQINAYDEASLMSLWEKYAEKVRHFEPTKRWEESVLVFNLIQSTRLKNQLFNYNWAQSRMPNDPLVEVDLAALTAPVKPVPGKYAASEGGDGDGATADEKKDRRGKLLTLTPKNSK